jgi:pseudouridine-5'-phosphate glycosidase
MRSLLHVSAEAAEALHAHRPVIALESTIISHGMPYPQNVETALAAEAIAREAGVVPAVVALLDGKIVVGLSREELERLATEEEVLKVSRRDLAWALAARRTGATTVSATMLAARQAGIDVFATGGIGGVHRGAGETFDVSADLTELAATSVCVVCAGSKAILDLPKTLEVLETLGVPVLGYGTDTLPAFYTRSSGLPLSLRVESAEEIAAVLRTQRTLGFPQGILVANPIPTEWEIPRAQLDQWISRAIADGEDRGISGKGVTPYLLSRIVELSGGASLQANIRLFHNNVRCACAVAAAISRQHGGG